MKHIFVINPAAGSGQSESTFLPAIHAAVKKYGYEYEIHRTLNKAEVCEYVRQRASVGDEVRFYACGGDGTINDVLCGMIDYPNAQLAVIPSGTGNDFAKNFSAPSDLKDIEKLMAADAKPCDVIKFDGGYCINMLNIGVDCDVVVESERIKGKVIKGAMSYAVAAVSVLSKGKTYKMSYEVNGEKKEEELFLCAIANGKFCGGGFKSCPMASVHDGLMDVCLVRPIKGLKVPKLLLLYRQGKHLESSAAEGYVEYLQCSSFKLTPVSDDINVSIDGEVEKFKGASFEVLRDAIMVAVPKGSTLM